MVGTSNNSVPEMAIDMGTHFGFDHFGGRSSMAGELRDLWRGATLGRGKRRLQPTQVSRTAAKNIETCHSGLFSISSGKLT